MRKSVIVMLVLGLLGWVTMGQATAQVISSDGTQATVSQDGRFTQVYSNWQFVPGYRNGSAPFGVWTVLGVLLLTSYLNGTDSCTVAGIVCLDDVAVLVLNTSATGAYPGTATGWYSYGWDGFGFTGKWK